MRVITRRGLAALALGLAAVTSSVLAGSPASAEPGTVTCLRGTTILEFDPPLTNELKMTTSTIHRQLGACTSTARPDITTGTADQVATVPSSCTRLLVGTPATVVIEWNTGDTSTVTFNAVSNVVQGELVTTYSGSVVAGVFDDSTFQWVETVVANPLLCSTTGLPSAFGLLTTQITSTA